MRDVYDDLNEGVRAWVDDRGWKTWTAIQASAMPGILAGRAALLVAPTASGKTEAALLPIVSRMLDANAKPVALLYVAPLRALINDQTQRAYKLLEDNGLRSEWWHGDLGAGKRKAILKDPPHALFTTPESLDVMLSSSTYGYGNLLGNARYVLIDEIHAFADNDRGSQLLSVLARLESSMSRALQRVALSATVGDPQAIANWMQSSRSDGGSVDIILDRSIHGRQLAVGVIPEIRDAELTKAERQQADLSRLSAILVRHVAGKRAIVFTGSRKLAEQLTVEMRARGIETFIHHGSVDREGRRATENAFKTLGASTIVATSTLELGIDIGDLELVIQVGAPATASSLLQRIGRSGRRQNADSIGILYAVRVEELPKALAVSDMSMRGNVESISPSRAAIQVLFQQSIQLVRERDHLTRADMFSTLRGAGSFSDVTQAEFDDLIDELLTDGFLEETPGNRLRIGVETEKKLGYANFRDFYALFEVEEGWTVRHGSETIGTLDRTYPVPENREVVFILAGRRWKVLHVDRERHVLAVEVATGGALPTWQSGGAGASFELMRRTIALLDGSSETDLEKTALAPYMSNIRTEIAGIGVTASSFGLRLGNRGTEVWTFCGDQLNAYLAMLIMADMPSEKAVLATETHLIVPAAPESVLVAVVRILQDPEHRAALAVKALEIAPPLGIGKYWRFFGPRTRRNILVRTLAAGEDLLLRLPLQDVQLMNRLPLGSSAS